MITDVEAAISDCKSAIANDADNIIEVVEKLRSTSMKIGQHMYQQNQNQQQQETNQETKQEETKEESKEETKEQESEKKDKN